MRFVLLGVGVLAALLGVILVGLSFMGGAPEAKPGQLDWRLSHKPTVMTVAYKAYGNPEAAGGKYWLSKLVIENKGQGPIRDLKVSYQIPDYINTWTTADEVKEVLPGQSAVMVYYPKLPKSVTEIRSKTPAELQVKLDWNDGTTQQSRVEKRNFEFRGITEIEYTSLPGSEIVSWYDVFDNYELLAAYVQDEDPVIAAYYAKVMEAAGGIPPLSKGETLQKFMESVYAYMVTSGMNYSAAKGVPESMTNYTALVQSIRLPREVVQNNTGLCIELALLWCAVGQKAGAKAYLILLPGHAFTVLQADDGTRIPIECTMIGGGGGANMGAAGSFEEAVKSGAKQLNELIQTGTPFFMMDINEIHQNGVRPPELPDVDIEAFKKRLDETRAAWMARMQQQQQQPQLANNNQQQQQQDNNGGGSGRRDIEPNPNQGGGGGGGGGNAGGGNAGGGGGQMMAGMVGWADPTGRVQMGYPRAWQPNMQNVQNMQQLIPGYVFAAANPMNGCGVDVVFFDGYDDAQDVIDETVLAFQQLGAMVNTGQVQQAQIAGRNAVRVPVAWQSQMGVGAGIINIIPINGGFVCVNVGGPQAGLAAAMPEFEAILQTVRVR